MTIASFHHLNLNSNFKKLERWLVFFAVALIGFFTFSAPGIADENKTPMWVKTWGIPQAAPHIAPLKPKPSVIESFYGKLAEARESLETEGDNPAGFSEWFYSQRRDSETKRIPTGALQGAQSEAKILRSRNASRAAKSVVPNLFWQAIGPSNIPDGQTDDSASPVLSAVSGRLQAIAVHPNDPNIVYAGGAQGGIWRTNNALSINPTWTPLTDDQPSLATGSLAIDPVNPNIIYVGTGEGAGSCDSYYGAGVLRSTDGGATWQQFLGPFLGNSIPDIVIDPASAGSTSSTIVYAAAARASLSSGTRACQAQTGPYKTDGGLFRSIDSGQTWTRLDVPTGLDASGTQVHDIELDPNNPATLFVSVRNNGFIATAAGIWQTKTANDVMSLPTFTRLAGGFPPSTGSSPGLQRIEFALGSGPASNVIVAAIATNPFNTLWGMFRSTDSGNSWSHIDNGLNGTGTITAAHTFTIDTGPAIPASATGRRLILLNTVNGRMYARDITAVVGNAITVGNFFSPELNINADVYTWSISNYPIFCHGQCYYDMSIAIDPLDASGNTIYVGGNPNTYDGNTAAVTCSGDFGDSAANCRHSIWRTTDGGITWGGVSQGDGVSGGVHTDDHELVFDPSDNSAPARLYNGNDGGIWRTDDAGDSWTSMNTNIAITQFQSIALHPTDTGIVLGGTQDNGSNILGVGGIAPPAWFHSDFGDGGQALIDQQNPNIMYHTYFNRSGSFMGPAESNTGGDNGPGFWDIVGGFGWGNNCDNGIDVTDSVSFYAPIALNAAAGNPSVVYFGSDTLYRNPDPGPLLDDGLGGCLPPISPWVPVSPDLTTGFLSAIGVHSTLVAGNELAYLGTSMGQVFVAPAGFDATSSCVLGSPTCPTWVNLASAPLPPRFVTDIYVDPSDMSGNTVYVTFSGFENNGGAAARRGHVFKTVNGLAGAGMTVWQDITGTAPDRLPDIPVNAITFDTTLQQLMVGTDIGVFQSSDDGITWSEVFSGHPNVSVFALKHNPTTGQTVSGTHGRGAFELVSFAILAATGTATPASVPVGQMTLLTVEVTPANNPASTNITAVIDLSSIGGSATQALFDDGSNGDLVAGDNVFSFNAGVAAGTTPGLKILNFTVTDDQGGNVQNAIRLEIDWK